MNPRIARKTGMAMKSKVARWALLVGAVLAVGFVYAYGRRSVARQALTSHRAVTDPHPFDAALAPPPNEEEIALAFDDDPEEFIDLDAIETEEPFDAVAPEDLAVEWLSRATQTLGVPTTEISEEIDDWDPAGRPTDPPSATG
jgi:hypothetical protein